VATVPRQPALPYAVDTLLPLERRIWCNRNLNLASIRAIGFDMDHTLALYRTDRFEGLVFSTAIERLIEQRRCPPAAQRLRYDPHYTIRGLVVDKVRGNVFKMDRNNYVTTAFHGRRRLSLLERKELYRNQRIDLDDPAFASTDTFFSLADVALFGALVQLYVERGEGRDWGQLFDHIRQAVDGVHRDGPVKPQVLQVPQRFFHRDPRLPQTLDQFRRSGKKLFLLTNSEAFYTDGVMGYLLNQRLPGYANWRHYFDVVVTQAGKPDFFRSGSAMERAPQAPNSYFGGSMRQLEALLGCAGDSVLYFGDHTYGDILRSKKSGWRTAMIVIELEREIAVQRRYAAAARRARRLHQRRQGLELRRAAFHARGTANRSLKTKLRRLEQQCLLLRQQAESLEKKIYLAHNRYWGRLFKEFGALSRFGRQVKTFACIYTSRVSNFLGYPPDHYFAAVEEWMPHEPAVQEAVELRTGSTRRRKSVPSSPTTATVRPRGAAATRSGASGRLPRQSVFPS
jgi:HAD superfamily 5'-nucleotidase-like hydrolase